MPLPVSPDKCADELARLLDAQTEVCRKILELSKRQQEMVENRRESDLLVLLSEKQQLIEKHQTIAKQAQPYREQWENAARLTATPTAHGRVENAWNKLRDVLDQIVKLEDASREMLQGNHGKLSAEIGKIQRGRIANKAYGGSVRPPPAARYSDKKG